MITCMSGPAKTDVWPTPLDFFRKMDRKYGPFDLDVCALPDNAKCPRYFTPEQDGLQQRWEGRCWCNPPYGKNYRPVGSEGVGIEPRGCYGGHAGSRPHRYKMVA